LFLPRRYLVSDAAGSLAGLSGLGEGAGDGLAGSGVGAGALAVDGALSALSAVLGRDGGEAAGDALVAALDGALRVDCFELLAITVSFVAAFGAAAGTFCGGVAMAFTAGSSAMATLALSDSVTGASTGGKAVASGVVDVVFVATGAFSGSELDKL